MSNSLSEERMAENEVVFRQYNESVQERFDEIERIAKEDGQHSPIKPNDQELHFHCECSDENCRERIKIKPSRYTEIHQRRDRFVTVCGHEVPSIESVVTEESGYCIIEKFSSPPEFGFKLNKTNINNT
ncbi:MAG TPA: hypothetical protein VK983_04850 [Candidatus Limnocylindrales bacterium]|nr:hypothetical protein [Candidatus Limnocylindrales bacterium]